MGAAHHSRNPFTDGRPRPDLDRRPANSWFRADRVPDDRLGAPTALGLGRRDAWICGGLRHCFEPDGDAATIFEWVVFLEGPLAFMVRPVFAAIYGRNLDRAIPRLKRWMA
jgi:hypothetical protein